MAGAPRPLHPLYPDVSAAEWEAAERKVLLHVVKKVGDALGEPLDIVKEAVARAYKPGAPVWTREKPLASYLGSFANSLMANALRKIEFKSTGPIYDSTLATRVALGPNPEEALATAEANAKLVARMRKVEAEVAHDPCCVVLMNATMAGEEKPHLNAKEAGFSYRQVELAREKIQRAAIRIAATEARAERKNG